MVRVRNKQSSDVAGIDRVTAVAFEDVVHSDPTGHAIIRALRAADALDRVRLP